MKVYLAPIIIVALIIAALIIFVACSTGFSGSIGAHSGDAAPMAQR